MKAPAVTDRCGRCGHRADQHECYSTECEQCHDFACRCPKFKDGIPLAQLFVAFYGGTRVHRYPDCRRLSKSRVAQVSKLGVVMARGREYAPPCRSCWPKPKPV